MPGHYFYGRVWGYGKLPTTTAGKEKTGIRCKLWSPNAGVEVIMSHDSERMVDIVEVYRVLPGSRKSVRKLISAFETKCK